MKNYIISLIGIAAVVAILGIAKSEFNIPEEIAGIALFSSLNFLLLLIKHKTLHSIQRRALLLQGFSFLLLAVISIFKYLNHGTWEISHVQLIGFVLIAPIFLLINAIVGKCQKHDKT